MTLTPLLRQKPTPRRDLRMGSLRYWRPVFSMVADQQSAVGFDTGLSGAFRPMFLRRASMSPVDFTPRCALLHRT